MHWAWDMRHVMWRCANALFLYKSQVIVSVFVLLFILWIVHCAWCILRCWTRPCSMFVLIDYCSAGNRAHQRISTTLNHKLVEGTDKSEWWIYLLFILSNCLIFIVFLFPLSLLSWFEWPFTRFHLIALVYLLLLCLCVDVLIKGANKAAREPRTEKQIETNSANENRLSTDETEISVSSPSETKYEHDIFQYNNNDGNDI